MHFTNITRVHRYPFASSFIAGALRNILYGVQTICQCFRASRFSRAFAVLLLIDQIIATLTNLTSRLAYLIIWHPTHSTHCLRGIGVSNMAASFITIQSFPHSLCRIICQITSSAYRPLLPPSNKVIDPALGWIWVHVSTSPFKIPYPTCRKKIVSPLAVLTGVYKLP